MSDEEAWWSSGSRREARSRWGRGAAPHRGPLLAEVGGGVLGQGRVHRLDELLDADVALDEQHLLLDERRVGGGIELGIPRHERHLAPHSGRNPSVQEALSIAALSGVDVRIMIPSKPDHPIVYRTTEFYASQIIQSGVKVYVYQNGFLHAKTMIVDGELVTVGTSNFDMRSFRLNFEVNAFIYNEEIARQVETDFLKDLHNCTIATKEYFDKQSRWKKFKQKFARLFAPIL